MRSWVRQGVKRVRRVMREARRPRGLLFLGGVC